MGAMVKDTDLDPARVALIGAGAIAHSYVPLFAQSRRAELAAICDVDLARAREAAQPLGIPAFASHVDLLASVDLDGVIICTPPVYHMEAAVDALRAGLHVLCEKPLTIGAFAAKRMFAAAQSAGRILTMASKFRFVTDIVRAKELLGAGTIGDIVRVENSFMSPVDMTARWNSNIPISGGGVLIDNGTHSVDIMRFLLGPIQAAYAVEMSVDSRYDGCDDTAHLFVRSASGIAASITLSWSLGHGAPWFLRIYGTQGIIDVGWRSSSYIRLDGAPVVFGDGYDKRAAFHGQIENFAGAILGLNEPALNRDDSIASVEVIDAAYDSLRRNSWSNVEVRRLTPFERLIARDAVVAV